MLSFRLVFLNNDKSYKLKWVKFLSLFTDIDNGIATKYEKD